MININIHRKNTHAHINYKRKPTSKMDHHTESIEMMSNIRDQINLKLKGDVTADGKESCSGPKLVHIKNGQTSGEANN